MQLLCALKFIIKASSVAFCVPPKRAFDVKLCKADLTWNRKFVGLQWRLIPVPGYLIKRLQIALIE